MNLVQAFCVILFFVVLLLDHSKSTTIRRKSAEARNTRKNQSKKAKCVTPHFASNLPDETFDVNKQCELEYGKGSKACTFMKPCSILWCTPAGSSETLGCTTRYMSWAEGTPCGGKRWCYHGECIERERLAPVTGGCGPWEDWEECSRTCGGGIKKSRRICNSPEPPNEGAYCTGRKVRYMFCNTQPCELGAPDFREQQCAKFNGNTKSISGLSSNVTWVPKYGLGADESCKLYCRVYDSREYYKLEEKVIDGTKCGLNDFNICVNGVCEPAGCYNELYSNTTLDDCDICSGDNSKCEAITGTYNVTTLGYNRVIRFLKGSSNIEVSQTGFQNNSQDDTYLALVDGETGKYILNGNSVVSYFPKDIIYGGITIKYSGSIEVVETLKTMRKMKLNKDLILEVLSVGQVNPPDIAYKYTISREAAPKYSWQIYKKNWSKCSSICHGMQYLQPSCVDLKTGLQVDDNRCSQLDMHGAKKRRKCNKHCKLKWKMTSKGNCSSHCGHGHRRLDYHCYKVPHQLVEVKKVNCSEEPIDENHCSVLAKPAEFENCFGPCDSTRWEYDPWSPCTKSCGGGLQIRTAVCVDVDGNQIDDSHCDKNHKHIEQLCNNKKCPTAFVVPRL